MTIKKSFPKVKSAIAFLLLSIFLFSSTILRAEEKSISSSSRDTMYEFVNDYEYFLTPIFDAVAAGFLCGPWCAIGGAALGGLDEALTYYKYADQRYLTYGILGAANGFMVSPTATGTGAGIVVGFLLPQGVLTNYPGFVAPAVSAIAAGSALGVPGIIGGAIAGGIDEVLLYNNIANKHYLTAISLGRLCAGAFFSPEIANFVAAGIGLIGVNWEQQIYNNFVTPLNTVQEIMNVYSKFIPSEQLNSHVEKYGIALAGTQLLVQLVSLKAFSFVGALRHDHENIQNLDQEQLNGFKTNAIYFAIFLVPATLSQIGTGYVDSYYNNKLYRQLHANIHSELYAGKNSLRIYHNKNYTQLTDNLEKSIQSMVYSGNAIASGTFSTAIQGAYGIGMIIVSSPNLAVYSALYNQAKTWISQRIADQYGAHDEKVIHLESDLATLKKDYLFNIMTIAERDGATVTQNRIGNLTNQFREEESKKQLWEKIQSAWNWMTRHTTALVDYYFIAKEIHTGRLQFSDRTKVGMAGGQVAALFALSGNLAPEVNKATRAMEKIVVLEGMIHAPIISDDQIQRTYDSTEQEIRLHNLVVGVSERILVKVDNLKLIMGKIYAVTGSNGCGKSSLLSKIKGIKDNGIGGTGEIHYPMISGKRPKIVMIGKDYFPPNYTLQSVILYPEGPEANQEQTEKIANLLNEMGLYEYTTKLDSLRDWNTLSMGEKKKISIISAIISKPDILIVDESLANLDPQSVQGALKILKKWLPNALILIVDHSADNHNANGIFDQELHIDSQTQKVILRDLASN